MFLKILSENLKEQYKLFNITSKIDYLKMFPNTSINKEAKSVYTSDFAVVSFLVNQSLFIEAIEILSQRLTLQESIVNNANSYFDRNNLHDFKNNKHMICRYHIFSTFKDYVDYKEIYESVYKYFPNFSYLSKVYTSAGTTNRWLEKKDYNKKAIFIGDVNKIVGLGRDSKTREIDKLKKLMQDCYRVNIIFILYGSTFTDLQSLNSGIRYTIFDSVDTREYSKFKADDPGEVNAVLCTLFDTIGTGEKIKKFKRSKIKT